MDDEDVDYFQQYMAERTADTQKLNDIIASTRAAGDAQLADAEQLDYCDTFIDQIADLKQLDQSAHAG